MLLTYYERHPDEIEVRLAELEREWDVRRAIQAEAPVVTLLFVGLGAQKDRRWLAVAAFAQCMLLLQAVRGWHPLWVPLRKLGLRTSREIEDERHTLLAMRDRVRGAAG